MIRIPFFSGEHPKSEVPALSSMREVDKNMGSPPSGIAQRWAEIRRELESGVSSERQRELHEEIRSLVEATTHLVGAIRPSETTRDAHEPLRLMPSGSR